MKNYDHLKIEKKWQKEWDKKKVYQAKSSTKSKKFYGLIEFPYPSGVGLHVGHIRSNTAMDIITRKRRMEGYNVLFPIGWDAFGLPTENYAIKTGIQPEKVTKQNTDTFRRQLKALGFGFDWSREVNTTDPLYYKWTQWIFLQMYKKGLAYKAKTTINWCPKDKIGLANEEVINGNCERCGTETIKKEKEQWMLGITKYADRLDKDLDTVNYLDKIKIQQRNWIGRSEGSEIPFKLVSGEKDFDSVRVFTTRADTLFGVTYVVLAPEHELVNTALESGFLSNSKEVKDYVNESKNKDEIERTSETKEKTGVELKGVKAINPANGEEVPVWIADYILANYGTGAVMAVPAHDKRDFEFAKKYGLPIKRVVEPIHIAGKNSEACVKDDLPFVRRNAVCVILRNPKDDKILCSSWKAFKMHGLITGGIEEGEDIVEAAKREVYEETGYKNIKLTNNPNFALHSQFYHRGKKENRWARFQYLFFDLIDESRDPISEHEASIHDIVWISKDEIKSFFTVIEGEFTYNFINNPDYIYVDDGILHGSGKFDDLKSEEARIEITKAVVGKIVTKYKLRDWVFSRQRYWGEPIPIVHCEKCGYVEVPEKDLPITLPKVKSYVPTDNGESPLAVISKWVNTKCPKCKGKAKRETDTMPNWAGSSWYYLRYTDTKNKKEFASKKALKYWVKNGVDWYNGGMEHTTLHLLYSRFWHKFLYDLKLVPTAEPYAKRTSQGMILADDGAKISKSKGNGIDPLDIVKLYGADTLRLYQMFMGPFDQSVAWNSNNLIGPRRFLERVWKINNKVISAGNKISGPRAFSPDTEILLPASVSSNHSLAPTLHKTIKKVTEDIESMNFNTAISSMMILVNEAEKVEYISKDDFKKFLQILAPFAPHITEELWFNLGEKKSIHCSKWPKWDSKKIINNNVKIVIQVNGKVRSQIEMSADSSEEEVKALALKDRNIAPWILDKDIKRVIYVKNRLINIVV